LDEGDCELVSIQQTPCHHALQDINLYSCVSCLQVVIIDTIVMEIGDDKAVPLIRHSCAAHDYDLMKPVVLATWKHGFLGACPDKSAIIAESQVTIHVTFLLYHYIYKLQTTPSCV
jgi:hypothetical protein